MPGTDAFDMTRHVHPSPSPLWVRESQQIPTLPICSAVRSVPSSSVNRGSQPGSPGAQ